jgi:L,D-peptidoglycan transpeptidase YkuD (ErfK/YbiS/YcfS/YnhG family)
MSLRDIVATIRRWRREPPPSAPAEAQADLIEVFKGERRMELKREGKTIRRYRVALGFSPERHKEREGDGRTPEGSYTVDARNPTGCVAITNAEIREVWSLVPTGVRVVIHP